MTFCQYWATNLAKKYILESNNTVSVRDTMPASNLSSFFSIAPHKKLLQWLVISQIVMGWVYVATQYKLSNQ